MPKRYWQYKDLLLPLLGIAAMAILTICEPMVLQTFRNAIFDQYQRWSPRVYLNPPVRIIDIDEDSLNRYGQWPWPRNMLADLLDKLRAGNPKVITLDIIFSEADRTSPQTMLKLWHLQPDIRDQLSRLPDHDRIFADSIKRGRIVLGLAGTQDHTRQQLTTQKAHILGQIPVLPYPFSHVLKSLPEFEAAAAGNGAINFFSTNDVVRKVPLLININGTLVPSLSAETLRVYLGEENYILRSTQHSNELEQISIGQLIIPTTAHSELWLHYTEPKPERYIPAWKVLAGEIPMDSLSGKILLVGSSATALDRKYNPLGNIMPGIEAHTQAIEQILSGKQLNRPSWVNAIELPVLMIGSLFVSRISLSRSIRTSSLTTAIIIAVLLSIGWSAFALDAVLLDMVTPSLAILLSFGLTSTISHNAAEKRQRWLKQAFSLYVSPNRVAHILDNPEQLQLGGEKRHCSFIFTDLAGFTQSMEQTADPTKAVSWLNGYLNGMIAIAFKHDGTLDRVVGDAIAILFSAPITQPDHQRRALLCALDMQKFADNYTQEKTIDSISFGKTRIGVHSGEVVVGNIGGNTMFDYRALGDPVNTASRLEGANKHLGTFICVSVATLSGCQEIPARPIGKLILKGKKQPLMTYQPLPIGTAVDTSYQNAYDLLNSNCYLALQAFSELAAQRPDDPLVNLHLKRLQVGESGDEIVLSSK